jgi:hypothetical protein
VFLNKKRTVLKGRIPTDVFFIDLGMLREPQASEDKKHLKLEKLENPA